MSTDQPALGLSDQDAAAVPSWRRRQMAAWGTHRARLGAVVALVGGGLVVVGTFLPWLEPAGQESFSGWKIYQNQGALHQSDFVQRNSFRSGSVFFTGLVTLIVGALIVLGAGLLLIAFTKAPPRTLLRRIALVLPAAVGSVAALIVTSVNLYYILTGPDPALSVGWGLWIVFAGAWVALLGTAVSLGGETRHASKRGSPEPR